MPTLCHIRIQTPSDVNNMCTIQTYMYIAYTSILPYWINVRLCAQLYFHIFAIVCMYIIHAFAMSFTCMYM
jgi:hypothetical protein